MMMPTWALPALVIQLVLTFFVPPLSFGDRNIFLSDLWCFVWVIAALILNRQRLKSIAPMLIVSALLVFLAYLHGAYRITVINLNPNDKHLLLLAESDQFSRMRELVVAVRFLSWIYAAFISFYWFSADDPRTERAFRLLCNVLTFCLFIELVIMTASKIFPSVNEALGHFYGYPIDLAQWHERRQGTFPSPLEAGTTITLAFLIVALRSSVRSARFWICMSAGIGAIWMAHAGTAAISLLFVAIVIVVLRQKNPWRWLIPVFTVVSLAIVLPIMVSHQGSLVQNKWANFTSRIKPWEIHLTLMSQRADSLLLGQGFAPYHMDNSYLFVLNRTGLLGFVIFLGFMLVKIFKLWPKWTLSERSVVIFLCIGALSLDLLIYRPVVALMLTVGLPALAGRYKLT